jgi:hypothetical protein
MDRIDTVATMISSLDFTDTDAAQPYDLHPLPSSELNLQCTKLQS